MIPDGVNRVSFSFKVSVVPFLPNVPDEKPREELPKSIEEGILIRVLMPVLDGVNNISPLMLDF